MPNDDQLINKTFLSVIANCQLLVDKMSATNVHSPSHTKSELDLQMQDLVKLKKAKAEEKCLCTEEEEKHAKEAAKLAAEEAKKAKAVVREAQKAKKQKATEVTAIEPGPKVKRTKTDEATEPKGSSADTPCQW